MIIRPARYQDRAKIQRLIRQTGVFTEKEIYTAIQVFDDALQQSEREEYFIFCAESENKELLGYICFGPIIMTDGSYDLYWVAVDKGSLRKHIGEKLLVFMEEVLAKKAARKVYVDTSSTSAFEPARRFYRQNGYELVCVLEDFYREGDHKMIYMKEVRKNVPGRIGIKCAG